MITQLSLSIAEVPTDGCEMTADEIVLVQCRFIHTVYILLCFGIGQFYVYPLGALFTNMV